jgi:uncharacterized coiled-coil protein SlyX
MPEEQKPSIDERIQALTMNLELLLKQGEEQAKRINEISKVVAEHEREMQRYRRALRAGLDAYLGNGDGGTEE